MDQITWVKLSRLRAHPLNSNAMPAELFEKLKQHIEKSGRYPPLIVRKMADGGCRMSDVGDEPHRDTSDIAHPTSAITYQVLDGHHRWRALEAAGHEQAACVVWDVDDEQALVLLSTLNRLEGRDDPQQRAKLLAALHAQMGVSIGKMSKLLPDATGDVRKLLSLDQPLPAPRPPKALGAMHRTVCFFLLPEQAARLEKVLKSIDESREAALLQLVGRAEGGD